MLEVGTESQSLLHYSGGQQAAPISTYGSDGLPFAELIARVVSSQLQSDSVVGGGHTSLKEERPSPRFSNCADCPELP